MKTGKSLSDFKKAHDPTYKVETPASVFSRVIPKTAKRFIITSAQNATPVSPEWWKIILNMATSMQAELLVVPLRYKNPTSQWSGSQRNAEHWAAEVRPYLWNIRKELGPNISLLADIKTQPTAVDPLGGFDALSHSSSGIVGHTKMALKSVPTPASRMAKLVCSTGACTVSNYTDSRAGKIGEFHHSLSAVLVEVKGKKFHLRQLHFDKNTESCTDIATTYYSDKVKPAARALALIMGDTHVDYIDHEIEAATFGKDGIIDTVKPQHLVWHDLLDGYSCNPHHVGNAFNAIAKRFGNADCIRSEVVRAIEFLRKHTPADIKSVVVSSNHDDFLRRWIIATDWRGDPTNSEFYLETALAMRRQTTLTSRGTSYPSPFAYWLESAKLPGVTVLKSDESFVLKDIELGMHGDSGPNGARGSIKNLRRIGMRSVIGHSHSPGIDEGCYQVGTSTKLRLEYNGGPSGWLNTHCILLANGKRQLINIVDGEWRL